jgi:hypothetical protein
VRHGDDLYAGQHEPIISKEVWNQVQALRRKRRRGCGGGPNSGRIYLLARLARCACCGLRLVSQTNTNPNGKSYPYYYCPSKRRAVDCETDSELVPTAIIDAQLATLVKQLRLPEDWRARLAELADRREERVEVEGKRRYLQGKLRRLRDLYVEGDYARAEYEQRKADLQAKLDALQVPHQPEVEKAGETLESLGQEWANAPNKFRRDMVRCIFEAVFVDAKARRLVCVKPYPPFVPLFRMDGLEEKEDGCFYLAKE